MKTIVCITHILLLFGCGLEGAGTAAAVAKLQAEQAKQSKEQMEVLKTSLDSAMKEAEQNRKKAEEEPGK